MSALAVLTTGAAGAAASTVVAAAVLSFPFASVAVTVIAAPFDCAGLKVTV